MKRVLVILLSLVFAMPTFADRDSHSRTHSEDFEILYRFARTDIDLDYLDNRRSADSLRAHLRNYSRIDSYWWSTRTFEERTTLGRQEGNQPRTKHNRIRCVYKP